MHTLTNELSLQIYSQRLYLIITVTKINFRD